MPVYRLDLSYDGSAFHGYARQPDVRTVQGVLEDALERLIGPVETAVAGRTDAGVHARQQVVSFQSGRELETERLMGGLNGLLAPEVSVWRASLAPEAFNARFSARSRTYRYLILNRRAPDPFLHRTSWHVRHPLDVQLMTEGASHLVGEHDFASFCRAAPGRGTVRRLLEARCDREPEHLVAFWVTASSFCHQMVRSMVALLVEVGRRRMVPDTVPTILKEADRQAARGAAPPGGLMLWAVDYPPDVAPGTMTS